MPLPSSRPSGLVHWVIPKITPKRWDFYGCLGTEERSLSSWRHFSQQNLLASVKLLKIIDQPSRWTTLCNQRLATNLASFTTEGGVLGAIEDHQIAEPVSAVTDSVDAFLRTAGASCILDITCLPKRFFFPVVKLLLRQTSIRDLIVTYTYPQRHTTEPLAESFEPYAHLPMFGGAQFKNNPNLLIVGVGFEPLGLQCHIDQTEALREIRLLLPFPAPTRAFKRSWELLRKLQKHRASQAFDIFRVDVRDVSDVFNRIISITRNGSSSAEFAPYGPKSMSLAMCLYACLTDSPVSYSQPTVYHPDYTLGVANIDGRPEIYAYCIRLNGRDFYRI